MRSENLELVERFYAEPDPLRTLAHLIAPDAEFDFTDAYPDRPIALGLTDARAFRRDGPWGELRFEPERSFDVGAERVLVFVRATGTGRSSGAPTEAEVAHEFTIRDGLLTRFKVYLDRQGALDANGLTE